MIHVAKKGEWVKIHRIVLESSERAPHIPEDTKKVPLEMWLNGFLEEDGEIGQTVSVKTLSGRTASGKLVEISPRYTHDFGEPIEELMKIGPALKALLEAN